MSEHVKVLVANAEARFGAKLEVPSTAASSASSTLPPRAAGQSVLPQVDQLSQDASSILEVLSQSWVFNSNVPQLHCAMQYTSMGADLEIESFRPDSLTILSGPEPNR